MSASVTDATAQVTVASTGDVFACKRDQTLLMAGLCSGRNLPYECASGGCGSCRCKLVSGAVETLWPEAPGLSVRDRRRGNIVLMCQSRPLGAVTIDVRVRGSNGTPRPLSTGAVIDGIKPLTHDMMHVTVVIERPMRYLPGQFAILELPGLGRRAYSMANSGDGGKCLAFIVKVKPNGCVSRDLAARRFPGGRLSIEGPYGHAYFRADGERPVIAIAGGSGLAPMWSIAQAASTQGKRDIHLYFGVNSARDICFTEEFANLSSIGGRVRTHVVVRDGERAAFRSGLVGDAVVDDFPDLKQFDVYMAGPPAMIDAVLKRFVDESRVDSERVFFDRFI